MSELEIYVSLPYAVQVVPEVDAEDRLIYVASNPELLGCMSHGDTPSEAIDRLTEARELYLSALLEKKVEPPLPVATTSGTGGEGSRMVWEVWEIKTSDSDPEKALPFGVNRQATFRTEALEPVANS